LNINRYSQEDPRKKIKKGRSLKLPDGITAEVLMENIKV
jgi:hypothetical protein